MRGTHARASAVSIPVATSRSTASGRIAAIRFWSPSPAPGSSAAGSRRPATARSVSCAIGCERDVLERSADELARAGQFAEHVGRDRARDAVVAEVDDPPRDDAQIAGGEVHRLADPLVAREFEALPAQERRDPGDREARVQRVAPAIDRRLQRPRLLEPALGPQPVAAAKRLGERRDGAVELRRTAPFPSRVSARRGLRGISAVTSSAATPPTTPSMKRSPGDAAGITMTISDWIAAAIAKLACGDRNRATARVARERERELPPAGARHEQQQLGDDDAHQHPEHRLEHATRARVADEAEARDRHGRREQRCGVPEDVQGEDEGARRRDDDLQDRDRRLAHPHDARAADRSARASRSGWPP